ncbi:nitronate monooxygenase family protein [uncultured Massilia sp.]|uniref:NAD(P)H-dependent flavin oxidoreductase n=1 Tax=uncultured Massilia sp. TaxID=169973 RepID=UPI0025ECF704|nr:nitronate monooxygenase [uncultured Massilia sp.]
MTASAQFLARLGIGLPLIQAPMAGTSTPQLAAAVAEAGALGSIAIGAASADQARRMIGDTRGLTARPFNVNVFCHARARRNVAREAAWIAHLAPLFAEAGAQPPSALDEIYTSFLDDEDSLKVLLETRPAVVSFHFGLPDAARIAALRAAGIYLMATATNLDEARRIERAGIDAIVAQGIEAGGHRGMFDPAAPDERLSAAVLTRLLVKRTGIPVVMAGGIMDGQGIRAALDLGAAAAQLGTAFVACPESAASAAHRALLGGERAATTRLSAAISGRPARGIATRLMAHGDAPGSPAPADYPVAYDAAKQLHAAATKAGIHEFGAYWAGQGAPLARALPAAELVRVLGREAGAGSLPG